MKITSSQLLYGVCAFAATAAADTTKNNILCATFFGSTSTSIVPTNTYALTITRKATLQVTSTPSTTITPPATADTVSETTTVTSSVTKPQVTDTFSITTTTTLVSTTTNSVTITDTSTVSTTSTITGTTTVPTSPGFTPAISEATAAPTVKRARRHALENRTPKYRTQCTQVRDGKLSCIPALYPSRVACGGLVEVFRTTTSTIIASTTATVTASPPPPSSTTTTLTAVTTTTIVPPDASTTETITATTSSTATVSTTVTTTQTTTRTQTVLLPTATYYAACDPATNSIVGVNGLNIYGFGTNNAVTQSRPASAYDCCVACITSPTCGASVFFSGGGVCFSVAETNGQCDPKVQVLSFFTRAGVPAADYISTGNCGAIALGSTT